MLNTDWFYLSNSREWEEFNQTSVFDGIWNYLWSKKDNLLYNIDGFDKNWKKIEHWERIKHLLKYISWKLADVLLWVNFKKPAKRLLKLNEENFEWNKYNARLWFDIWYYDNIFLIDTPKIMEKLNSNSIWLAGAVADCAGVCGTYENGEIISLSHIWWVWVVNGVIEQLIYTYMAELGKEEFKKVQFDFSPMAGVNYEWDSDSFFEKFWKILDEYNIDAIKEQIFVQDTKYWNLSKWDFYLDRLIKRIFLENGANIEQLHFHKDYTTDLGNKWPSYRIHSLFQKWIILPEHTKKSKNWIVPDARMLVANIVHKNI